MSKIQELADYLKSLGYTVETHGSEVRVLHGTLPLYLKLEFKDEFVYISINHTEEFREVLEELRDSGEEVEEIVENALSYLNIASLKARMWIEKNHLVPVYKLREGSIEIYEILEEVLEEGEKESE